MVTPKEMREHDYIRARLNSSLNPPKRFFTSGTLCAIAVFIIIVVFTITACGSSPAQPSKHETTGARAVSTQLAMSKPCTTVIKQLKVFAYAEQKATKDGDFASEIGQLGATESVLTSDSKDPSTPHALAVNESSLVYALNQQNMTSAKSAIQGIKNFCTQ